MKQLNATCRKLQVALSSTAPGLKEKNGLVKTMIVSERGPFMTTTLLQAKSDCGSCHVFMFLTQINTWQPLLRLEPFISRGNPEPRTILLYQDRIFPPSPSLFTLLQTTSFNIFTTSVVKLGPPAKGPRVERRAAEMAPGGPTMERCPNCPNESR